VETGDAVVTFPRPRGLSAADKSRLSEAMLEAQVAAGYHRADRFHRFLEIDQDDLLVDPRFPDYATDRTERFMVVEVVISSGRRQEPPPPCGRSGQAGRRAPTPRASDICSSHEVDPNLPRFPAASSGERRPDA